MQLKSSFSVHKVTYLLLAITAAVVVALLAAPAFSASTSQCSTCHGTKYSQTLDIVEGNSQNKIPTIVQVGQTQTVTVAVSNINNAPKYNQLTSFSLTLSSQNGHFTVASPTVNVGTLSTGTTTATWQITGTSQGSDALVISASATNTHNNLKLSDSYAPTPAITVAAASTPTSTSSPAPTSIPTSTPSPTTTVIPIPTPAPTPTPDLIEATTSTPSPTAIPTANPTQTPTPESNPTETSPPFTTPSSSPTPGPSQSPTTTNSPTSNPPHNPTQDPTSSPQPNQTPNPTDTSNTTQSTPTPALVNQPAQNVYSTPSSSGSSTATLTVVAQAETHISWATTNQELTLNPNGATQPLTVTLQYTTTDGTSPLSANTLALSWTAIGGAAPLKTTLEYQLLDGSWTNIAQNILGDGSYTWTFLDRENSIVNTVKLRVSVSDSSAVAQTVSASATIAVSYAPKHAAVSQSILYNQMFGLSTAMFGMVLYVRKMKAKRISIPTITTKAIRGLKR